MAHLVVAAKAGHTAPKAHLQIHAQGKSVVRQAPKSGPKTTPKAAHPSAHAGAVLAADARKRGLIARPHTTPHTAALHGKKAPAVKLLSIDDHIRADEKKAIQEINDKLNKNRKPDKKIKIDRVDFERDGKIEGLTTKLPTLIRTIRSVSSLTKVPFNYLFASLYAESNLRVNAVNGEAKGIAQSMRIAWDQLKKSDENYKNFKRLWDQLSPGQKLPSGPGQSPSADILFMAVWTLKREKECSGVALLEGPQKEMARRLCYKLQGKAVEYIDNLRKDGWVVFKDRDTNGSWQTFIKVLGALPQVYNP